MANNLKLPTNDEVRDELITTFCNPTCPDSVQDSHCPDHSCPVWKALDSLIELLPVPKKHDIVQLLNPVTHRYVKLDRTIGGIISHKKSEGAYKNIPIVGK